MFGKNTTSYCGKEAKKKKEVKIVRKLRTDIRTEGS